MAGAGATDTGLATSSASGCLQCSMVIVLTTASRGIFGGYRIIATRSRGYGTSAGAKNPRKAAHMG